MPYLSGFVNTDSVGLAYLDWGGTGPSLILIHGLGDNPHIFDDFAPAFIGSFHVIAYARRSHGLSETKTPYDTRTLASDLLGLMNALNIAAATLVGWSMGGNEITEMAAKHPERVDRIIYLDGGYDYADPEFKRVVGTIPAELRDRPQTAMASLDAFRAHERRLHYPSLDDMTRIDSYLRALVLTNSDGTVRFRMSKQTEIALFESLWADSPRDYLAVRCPALALYAKFALDPNVADAETRRSIFSWETLYMTPFRRKSIERVRAELQHATIVLVPGAHNSFFLTHTALVVDAITSFLRLTTAR